MTMTLSQLKHAGASNDGSDYDAAHRELGTAEQLKPCTCMVKAKLRTGGALYPSLIEPSDVDPNCELHLPWMIEDDAERVHVMRFWMAGYQAGYATASAHVELSAAERYALRAIVHGAQDDDEGDDDRYTAGLTALAERADG